MKKKKQDAKKYRPKEKDVSFFDKKIFLGGVHAHFHHFLIPANRYGHPPHKNMTIGVNFLDITNVSLFPKKRPKGQKMFHFSTKKRVFLLFPIFFSNLLSMKIPLFMVAPEVGWLLRLSAGPLHAECSLELFGKARLPQRGFFFTRFHFLWFTTTISLLS